MIFGSHETVLAVAFFDGGWPETGDRLTAACKKYPEFKLYVGDDGLIYS